MQKSFHRSSRAGKRDVASGSDQTSAENMDTILANVRHMFARENLVGLSAAPIADLVKSDEQTVDLMSRLLDHAGEKIEIMNKDIDDTRSRISGIV